MRNHAPNPILRTVNAPIVAPGETTFAVDLDAVVDHPGAAFLSGVRDLSLCGVGPSGEVRTLSVSQPTQLGRGTEKDDAEETDRAQQSVANHRTAPVGEVLTLETLGAAAPPLGVLVSALAPLACACDALATVRALPTQAGQPPGSRPRRDVDTLSVQFGQGGIPQVALVQACSHTVTDTAMFSARAQGSGGMVSRVRASGAQMIRRATRSGGHTQGASTGGRESPAIGEILSAQGSPAQRGTSTVLTTWPARTARPARNSFGSRTRAMERGRRYAGVRDVTTSVPLWAMLAHLLAEAGGHSGSEEISEVARWWHDSCALLCAHGDTPGSPASGVNTPGTATPTASPTQAPAPALALAPDPHRSEPGRAELRTPPGASTGQENSRPNGRRTGRRRNARVQRVAGAREHDLSGVFSRLPAGTTDEPGLKRSLPERAELSGAQGAQHSGRDWPGQAWAAELEARILGIADPLPLDPLAYKLETQQRRPVTPEEQPAAV